MGSSIQMPQAPAAPTPIDPGKSALDYMNSMADPALQEKILQSEQTYRPQYAALNLADLNSYLQGTGGQMGALEQSRLATESQTRNQIAALSAQRGADIADVEQYGTRASDAFLNANPQLRASLERADALAGPQQNQFSNLLSAQLRQQQPRENIYAQQVGAAQMGGLQQVGASQIGGFQQVGAAQMGGPQQIQAAQMGMGQQIQAAQLGGPQQVNAALMNARGINASGIGQSALGAGLQQGGMDQLYASQGEQGLNQAGLEILNRRAGASPLQVRNAIQQARIASQARGRSGDMSSMYGEIGARLSADLDLENRNLGLGSQLLNQGFGMGQQRLGMAGNIYGQDLSRSQSNASMQQQAALANQQAFLSSGQANQQAQMQAQLANQQAGINVGQSNQQALMQSQLANQQSGLTVGQANQQALMNAQQLNQQAGLTVGQANQQALMNAQQLNQQAGLTVGQANQQAMMQSQLANQQAGLTVGQANQQAMMQAQLANQQANLGASESNRANAQQQYQNYIQNLGQGSQLFNQGLAADRGYAMGLVGARQATASDPFQAILGRGSNANQMGLAQQQFAQGMAGQQGPQLFDPNAGINLALGQQSNLNNYNASIYGAQAGFAGAKAQARGAMIGGALGGLGAAASGGFAAGGAFGCWVAREVFGEDNPKWLYFRAWLYTKAPKWFCNLYLKHGERFAAFIKNKPMLKSVIRMWMNRRIKNAPQLNLA